jgi:hypothetical protein
VIISKDPIAARRLVRGEGALRANLIYLEYQSAYAGSPAERRIRNSGVDGDDLNEKEHKVWKFYGSPGSPEFGG